MVDRLVAVDDTNYRLPAPVLAAMGPDINELATEAITSAGPFRDELNATITSVATPVAQTAAAEYLASDPGVADAAEVAVADAIAGLVPGIVTYDTPETRVIGAAQVDIDDSDGPVGEVESLNLGWSPLVSPSGVVPEIAVDKRWRVLPRAITSWLTRVGMWTPAMPFDVVAWVGQSNSTGADPSLPIVDSPDPRVWFMNQAGVVSPDSGMTWSTDPATMFARHYARTRLPEGRRVLMYRGGEGATGFDRVAQSGSVWDPLKTVGTTHTDTLGNPRLVTTNLGLLAVARITEAVASVSGSRLIGVYSAFGENDTTSGVTKPQMLAYLSDLVSRLRTAGGNPDAWAVFRSMTPDWTRESPAAIANPQVAEALVATAQNVSRSAYIPAPENAYQRAASGGAGYIHTSSPGQIEWVRDEVIGWGIDAALSNVTGGEPFTPRDAHLVRYGDECTVWWRMPWGNWDTITADYSTDNGSTWLPMTVDPLLGNSATATVTASSRVLVRLTTTNEVGFNSRCFVKG